MPEVIAIPFFIISSEILINSKIIKRFKKTTFSIFGNNIFGFLFFSLPVITSSSTSMIFVKLFHNIFSKKEFLNRETYIRKIFILSTANYIAPISVPIILITSLLKISLKMTTIYSLLLTIPFIIINYFIFINKKFNPITGEKDYFSIFAIFGYSALFYILMFIKSLPIDIISIIMFFYSVFIGLITKKRFFIKIFKMSILHSLTRVGIIIGVVYFIFIINFFHIYTFANNHIINYFTLSFTEGYYILIILYIFAFFMLDFIDPLGIILTLFPIYNPILTTFNINKYYFAISFAFFVSTGLFNNIAELAGKKITEKFDINFSMLSSIISPIYFIICIIAFGIYFI
jgi:TRAP-type C4-dicarboxylate transport system permease large subunit